MIIEYPSANDLHKIKLFTTTRMDGVSVGNYASLNVSPFCGDNPKYVKHNLQQLAGEINISPEKILIPYQVHGREVRKIDAEFIQSDSKKQAELLHGIDALVTNIPGICIGVTTADCVPVFLYDTAKQVVAVAHAGWRGTCAKIASKTIHLMVSEFNCKPEDVHAVIGPSISVHAYQVGEELHTAFQKAGFPVEEIFTSKDTGLYLDLWKANEFQLLSEGVINCHIAIANRCTYTEYELFFSARRLGLKSGRMLSGICIHS
ncbi:MAG: peptidoglycan editing factor PgeF [Paludibacter sp.]|jgi:YfiH family protein|nr:peptidoglycan editing factor PgeF [Paludibacter sp.]